MRQHLGQIVLKRKDNLALDGRNSLGHTVRMVDSETEAQYKQAFIARVKAARIAVGMKQWELANLLQVPQDHYKHWEASRLLPHHIIGRFCLACRIEPEWLLTGKGEKPLKPPHIVEKEQAPIPKPKRAKRSRAA
jgi:DNA-binding transcriptional regulator YiaG